mgnify:CR=1 FL=1
MVTHFSLQNVKRGCPLKLATKIVFEKDIFLGTTKTYIRIQFQDHCQNTKKFNARHGQ